MQRLEGYRVDFIAWSDPAISMEQLDAFVAARMDAIRKQPEWEGAEEIYRRLQTILNEDKARRRIRKVGATIRERRIKCYYKML